MANRPRGRRSSTSTCRFGDLDDHVTVTVNASVEFLSHQKILEIPERQYKYLKVSVMYHMRCEFAASL